MYDLFVMSFQKNTICFQIFFGFVILVILCNTWYSTLLVST